MKRKWIILVITVMLAVVALYAYREYNRKNVPMSKMSADFTVGAIQLLHEFEKDDATANKKYLGKVIIVDGMVKQVDITNRVMVLGDTNSTSSIRCALDSGLLRDVNKLHRGMIVKVKGNCTGYNEDELLGSDIILNRAVIVHIF